MASSPKIVQLLETLMDSGGSPEDVCAECPELLGELKEQWEQCRRVDARINAFFGSIGELNGDRSDRATPADLPSIPGYQVIGEEGRGGMGVVYRARHLELNRIIALKMLLSGAYAGRVERIRFLREARAVAGLRHANIVQVYDVGEFENRPFFTMELVEGKTLAEFLGGNPQPSADAAAMLVTLADAVESAHQNGIVHRDLKPTNVLLTEDGTPKISDFGLARRLEGEAALTLSGMRLGTPSYMSPEQALGKAETVGPAADVYSLGAILYEMLTGRPPFRGESAAETERQLIAEDPVQPSKLNARIPRDLETICLKCLQKDPRRRYPTAALLAVDLRRFQWNEPISARQIGALERTIKWVRRRPATATALVASLLIMVSLVGTALWIISARATTTKAVEQDLREIAGFQKLSNWPEANAALDRATIRLGSNGPRYLIGRLDLAHRDSDLAAKLEKIRMSHVTLVGSLLDTGGSYGQYATAFHDGGLIVSEQENPENVAIRIDASNIRAALVAALANWLACTKPQKHRDWLLNVMRIADSDPTGWRDRFRADKVWNNAAALKKAAAEASIEEIAAQPTPFLLTIEVQLRRLGQDSIPFMTRVQEMHPADFWANVTMGFLRWKMKPELPEAIRYYQTAVALRPDAASIHYQLGSVLWEVGRNDEAIVQYRLSLQLDPGYTFAHGALGVALAHLKDYDHSVIELREAMRENPTDIGLYGILGDVFTLAGRDPDALEQYRKGAELRPKLLAAQRGIRATLCREGRPAEEVFAAWKTAIDANPNDQEAVEGYAEYCLYAGQADKYPEACRNLLDRFGKITDPRVCERMGRACLLAACSPSQLSEATALVDRAVASEENHKTIYASFFQFAKALAEYRAGDMDAVCTRIDGKVLGVLGPAPRLVLAMAQFRLGNVDEAKKNLAQAIRRIDWSPKRAQYAEDWMNHILRREAEEMILSNGE